MDDDVDGNLEEELDVGLTRIGVLVGDGEAVLGITVVGTELVNVETTLVGTGLVDVATTLVGTVDEIALVETELVNVELALEETGFTIVELALEETELVNVETTLVGIDVLAVILDEEDETAVGITKVGQLEKVAVEVDPIEKLETAETS